MRVNGGWLRVTIVAVLQFLVDKVVNKGKDSIICKVVLRLIPSFFFFFFFYLDEEHRDSCLPDVNHWRKGQGRLLQVGRHLFSICRHLMRTFQIVLASMQHHRP